MALFQTTQEALFHRFSRAGASHFNATSDAPVASVGILYKVTRHCFSLDSSITSLQLPVHFIFTGTRSVTPLRLEEEGAGDEASDALPVRVGKLVDLVESLSFSHDGVGDNSSDLVDVRDEAHFEVVSFAAASFLDESFSHDGVGAASRAGRAFGGLDGGARDVDLLRGSAEALPPSWLSDTLTPNADTNAMPPIALFSMPSISDSITCSWLCRRPISSIMYSLWALRVV